MSMASKCDVCDALFEPSPGTVSMDIRIITGGGIEESWSEIDLCKICGLKVKTVIQAALSPEKEDSAS